MKNKRVGLGIVAILALAAWAASGMPQAQYRTAGAEVCRVSSQTCDQSTMLVKQAPSAADGARIYLGFIEFDDQGDLWNRAMADEVIDSVKALADDGPVSIVVFAHGWNHGAAAGDDNVTSFHEFLGSLHEAEAAFAAEAGRDPTRTVVGIYLGWRGKSVRGPLHYLTFWSRKSAAHRVGNGAAFEVLKRLSVIRNRGEHANANRLVLVGHSFGGALMATATAQALTASLEDLSGGRNARFADLVVILNAAIEARRFDALFSRSRALEASLRAQMPLFLSVTSERDLATRWAFPAGRWLGTVFGAYRSDPTAPGHEGDAYDQGTADRTSIGHYKPLLTHVLAPCVSATGGFAALGDCSKTQATQPGSAGDSYIAEFRTTAGHWHRERQTPMWRIAFPSSVHLYHVSGPVRGPVMNVVAQKSLVVGHNGIWGSRLMLFVRDLVAMSYAAERPRVVEAADPPPATTDEK